MIRLTLLAPLAAFALVIGGAQFVAVAQTPAPSSSAAPVSHVVHVKNFAYAPPSLTITTGESVTFINDDVTPHTVTASDSAKTFDSGNMDQNATWKHAFTKAGTYAYFCTYHPYMKGTITVKDAAP